VDTSTAESPDVLRMRNSPPRQSPALRFLLSDLQSIGGGSVVEGGSCHRRVHRSHLHGEHLPRARYTLELVLPAVGERDTRAGHEIAWT
jgi:hypothetical protein